MSFALKAKIERLPALYKQIHPHISIFFLLCIILDAQVVEALALREAARWLGIFIEELSLKMMRSY